MRTEMRAAMVPVDRIRMHPRNIRKTFTGLDELAASIRHEGVLEPLVCHQKFRRAAGVQDLELIAGHRRLAAAGHAGLRRVPVFVVPTMQDDEAILAMLAENTQRCAVPVADLGRAITDLHDEFGYDYASLAERLGITRDELRDWRQGRHLRSTPRRVRADTGRPKATPAPRLRPAAVHDLVQRFDAGSLDVAALVDELRGWLGDWKPAKPKPPREPEPVDWAAVEGLVAGRLRAGQARPVERREAVRRMSDQGMSAAQVADRIGVSQRQVVRMRTTGDDAEVAS